MLLEYVVAPAQHLSLTDMLLHVGADVCLQRSNRPQLNLNRGSHCPANHATLPQIALRFRSPSLDPFRPVTTSTRIPVLSP
jgi:hypothetical protein